jgi:hypothetical protein
VTTAWVPYCSLYHIAHTPWLHIGFFWLFTSIKKFHLFQLIILSAYETNLIAGNLNIFLCIFYNLKILWNSPGKVPEKCKVRLLKHMQDNVVSRLIPL